MRFDTYPVLETRLVLKAIDREAPGLILVAVRVRRGHDRRRLLRHAPDERVLERDARVRDDLILARVQPGVPVVERLIKTSTDEDEEDKDDASEARSCGHAPCHHQAQKYSMHALTAHCAL